MLLQGVRQITAYAGVKNKDKLMFVDPDEQYNNAPCAVTYSVSHEKKNLKFVFFTHIDIALGDVHNIQLISRSINKKVINGKLSLHPIGNTVVVVYTQRIPQSFGYRHTRDNLTKFIEDGINSVMTAAKMCVDESMKRSLR